MMRTRKLAPIFSALALGFGGACGEDEQPSGPPPCGSLQYNFQTLIPGPAESAFDAALDQKARKIDRSFHAINAAATGLNADVVVGLDRPAARAKIETFLAESDDFDFADTATVVAGVQKSAGLYSGAGIAADAWRYGTLRDQGASCADIDIARAKLEAALDSMHIAVAITGAPGVIARSLARKDREGDGRVVQTVPLFDGTGAPLPIEKNNGTWREDQSGAYPEWVWEDSTSRDMLVGWAMAFGAAAEVLEGDDTISETRRATLRADARAIAEQLMIVRPSGYDLEIIDADGRTTFHGVMNENGFDRAYVPGVNNGFYAVMSLGIVAALARAADEPAIDTYLAEELITKRKLPSIARMDMLEVNLGVASNFSNYNMAFTGALLAMKYLEDRMARGEVRIGVRDELYAVPDSDRQPIEMKQSFFDFIWAITALETKGLDSEAVARGLETLREYPEAPFWELGRTNCDEAEIAAARCELEDGTTVDLLGYVGRGEDLVAAQPIPMRVRPPSNYFWRSNPYQPNGGGDGSRLLPAVDFRVAYWLARWTRL